MAGAAYGYDANGNLTSDGATTFAYDAENRLISASGSRTATLAYDPLGRLWRTSGGAFGKTDFVYDAGSASGTGGDALVIEYDGDTGGIRRRYMHGPDVDEPVMWDEGAAMDCSGSRFLHPDERGSVVALADCFGNRVTTNRYDEYGVPAPGNFTAALRQRFQYTGQIWLPELGLYHYKARVYSPTLGRFLQTDPVGYDDQVNLYAYVANDPVNEKDPTGMISCGGRDGRDYVSSSCSGSTAAAAYDARTANERQDVANQSQARQPGYRPGMGVRAGQNIRIHEGGTHGGHTIRFHVGLSTSALRTRMSRDPGLRRASSFYNEPTANAAFKLAVSQNQNMIRGWLIAQGGQGQLTIKAEAMTNIGRTLERGARHSNDTNIATFYIRANQNPFLRADIVLVSGFPGN